MHIELKFYCRRNADNYRGKHTSVDFSLALKLATRSCVVTGALCNRTALISSSVTGPAFDVPAALDDDGVGFEDELLFEPDGFSSLIEDFGSWFHETKM